MRSLAVPLLLFVAGSVKICNSEDKAKVDASGSVAADASVRASADAKVVLAAPRIGGTVASAGELSVEVAMHRSGLVEALVSDATGKLVSDGVKLSATLQTKAGGAEKLNLAFVPRHARFEGRVKAGVELSAGPVEALLEVAGKTLGCKLNVAAVLPESRIGGHLLTAGAFSAEVLASPTGEVRALVADSAGAEVTGSIDAKLSVTISTKAATREAIALDFDAARACFAGKAKAGIALAPGPLEFSVDAKVGGGTGRLEGIGLSVAASHGGQVVAVGDFSVELAARGPAISAFVIDAAGRAHVGGDLDLKLLVGAGAGSELALKWDAPSASYVGKAAANIDLGLEPLRIAIVAGGKAFLGGVASLDALARGNAKLDGKLDVGAKLDAGAKLDGQAKLAADAKAKVDQSAKAVASLKVTPPKVDLNAKKAASASAKAGGGKADAKASAGFSFGTK